MYAKFIQCMVLVFVLLYCISSTAAIVVGNPQGKVTLVEFYDYQCAHCRVMAPLIQQLIPKNPDLKVIYYQFPILGPGSDLAARAALVSAGQQKFEVMHTALMQLPVPINSAEIDNLAEAQGINRQTFDKALFNSWVTQRLQKDIKAGIKIGVRATPFILVGKTGDSAPSSVWSGETSLAELQSTINHIHETE